MGRRRLAIGALQAPIPPLSRREANESDFRGIEIGLIEASSSVSSPVDDFNVRPKCGSDGGDADDGMNQSYCFCAQTLAELGNPRAECLCGLGWPVEKPASGFAGRQQHDWPPKLRSAAAEQRHRALIDKSRIVAGAESRSAAAAATMFR